MIPIRHLNPLRHLPRFREARKMLGTLADREEWSRQQIESYQLNAINEIWAKAKKGVPAYRDMANSRKLPDRFRDLDEYSQVFPILKKSVVRDHPGQFLAEDALSGSWHRTGGSTGTPMRVFWEKEAHLTGLRAKYRMLDQRGVDVFDRSAFLWGHSGSIAPGFTGVKQRLRRPIEDAFRNRLRVSAYRLGPEELDEHLTALRRFSPLSLYGYSSAVALLARRAKETGVMIPSLRLAIMTAEPADDAMVRQVASDLSCDAVVEYGSVECGLMATTFPDRTLRIREDIVYLETVQNELGDHDIVVTVLRNGSFPLLRYRIEDVTSAPIEKPDRGFAILADVIGRQNDVLSSKDGSTIHSMAVKHELEHFSVIRRFRAIQKPDGSLNVKIETLEPERVPSERIQRRLEEMMKGYPVTIDLTDRLSGNLAGKHRWIVSEMV